jgi:chromosome segregation ATPase
MSDTEQAVMASMLEEVPVAAPLVRARENLLAARSDDETLGLVRQRLKMAGQGLSAQWRQAQEAEKWAVSETVAREAQAQRVALEAQVEDWQQQWEVIERQRQAQSQRLLAATGAFRALATEAEALLARIRQAARALAELQARSSARPFDRMEIEAEVERGVARLAALIGPHEAEALAQDGTRTPSWRL